MKILLLGNKGQLGGELYKLYKDKPDFISLDYPEINYNNPAFMRSIEEINPNIIINTIAYTNVDGAEDHVDEAYNLNTLAVMQLAKYTAKTEAFLIHFSTDYVFDGTKQKPYTEKDKPNPINVYGLSKFEGEKAVQRFAHDYLILRTSWLYSNSPNCFVGKILSLAQKNKELNVVADQFGSPTSANILAQITYIIIEDGQIYKQPSGIYHCCGNGYTSRYNWVKYIMMGESVKLNPILTEDFPTVAKRPLFTALNCSKFEKTFHFRIPFWLDSYLSMKES